MADILIRDMPIDLKAQVEKRARAAGHSISEEAKRLLAAALTREEDRLPLGKAMREAFGQAGYVDLELPARTDSPVDPFAR